jgi:geranylgeranyl pyrophosphate synthase
LLGYYAACDTPDKNVEDSLCAFSEYIGIAFQIRDDILDKISDKETLGKNIGSDEKNQKNTSLTYMSIEDAQAEVDTLTNKAICEITKYCDNNSVLPLFARYLVDRKK